MIGDGSADEIRGTIGDIDRMLAMTPDERSLLELFARDFEANADPRLEHVAEINRHSLGDGSLGLP